MATNKAQYKFTFGTQEFSIDSSADVEILPLPLDMITVVKVALPTSVYVGEIVAFTVTVTTGALPFKLKNQSMVDTLPPELVFIANSLKLDGAAVSGDISNLTVDFEPNTSHKVEYQCTAQ